MYILRSPEILHGNYISRGAPARKSRRGSVNGHSVELIARRERNNERLCVEIESPQPTQIVTIDGGLISGWLKFANSRPHVPSRGSLVQRRLRAMLVPLNSSDETVRCVIASSVYIITMHTLARAQTRNREFDSRIREIDRRPETRFLRIGSCRQS